MERFVLRIVLGLLVVIFFSCATSSRQVMKPEDSIIGTVELHNISAGWNNLPEGMKNTAYPLLLTEARKNYSGNVDVIDIAIRVTNYKEGYGVFSASGTVILIGGNKGGGVEGALARAAEQTLKNVPLRSRIAIVYITAQDRSTTEYIAGELEFIWVNAGYIIADRSELDRIRREQNFQMSGEVDDDTAVSIGQFIGANMVITGRVDGEGNLRRLRLRALNTQTAQVVGVASERL
ncbi:MAG: penicillin-binding protein activator LpoB [Treponema sp.]|jgi:hypothetical protein|nr:penicillin-binding protein activator LpoB [Treponema sp.]